jgi:hypothetical protein
MYIQSNYGVGVIIIFSFWYKQCTVRSMLLMIRYKTKTIQFYTIKSNDFHTVYEIHKRNRYLIIDLSYFFIVVVLWSSLSAWYIFLNQILYRLLGFSPCSNVRDCIGKHLMFLFSRFIKYMTISYIFYFDLEALDIVVELY